ncbi:MAG TPA: surface lipoprotein assembly modifier, partial [Devosia sp.]|nr:surface lipoprotein assembly modifier [Devosia sp.]
ETPMTFGSLDNVTFLATPFVTAALSNGQHSHTKAGGRGIVAVQLSPVISATLTGSAAYAAFPLQPFRDGWQYELSLGSSWVVNPQTMLSASLKAAFDATDDASRQTTELSARLRVDHAMASGLVLGGELTVGTRLHNAPPPLSNGANQQDQFASVRLEASHRDIVIGPFMPQIYYEYATQASDNAFYRYDSHDIGLAMRARL